MLIGDEGLNAVVWVQPTDREEWEVRVGDSLLIYRGSQEAALRIERKLKDGMMMALKQGILSLTKDFCKFCAKGQMPKRRRIKDAICILHYVPTLGWQSCEAEHIFIALMQDTKERTERVA